MRHVRFLTIALIAAAKVSLFSPSLALAATEKAVFAGGCFWCVESDFESLDGVKSVVSGYSGGESENPTYDDHAEHLEAVEITYDPDQISYDQLVSTFLRSVDVTDDGGQFCDRGNSYRAAIFVETPQQREAAEAAIKAAEDELGFKIVTPIRKATPFWNAEDYHQDYYKGTNIVFTRIGPKQQKSAYRYYRISCGRDKRVAEIWGDNAPFTHKYLEN